MKRAVLFALALAALPAAAGHRSQSFRVAAVVIRSARVQATPDRLRLSQPALVAVGSEPPRLVTAGVPLAPGVLTVTVHY